MTAAWVWVSAAIVVGIVTVALFVRHRYAVVTVQGVSMQPTLCEGDRVLVRRVRLERVRTGQIVVVERPPPPVGRPLGPRAMGHKRWLIKRAAAIPGEPVPEAVIPAVRAAPGTQVPEDHLVVLGDNATASVDSRVYGYIRGERLLGVVLRPLR